MINMTDRSSRLILHETRLANVSSAGPGDGIGPGDQKCSRRIELGEPSGVHRYRRAPLRSRQGEIGTGIDEISTSDRNIKTRVEIAVDDAGAGWLVIKPEEAQKRKLEEMVEGPNPNRMTPKPTSSGTDRER